MNRRILILCAIALALVGGTALFLYQYKSKHRLGDPGVRITRTPLIDDQGNIARTNSVAIPTELTGWITTNQAVTALEASYLPADTLFGRRAFSTPDGSFQAVMSVVLMGTDRTSIHRPEACLPGQGLILTQNSITNIPVNKPHPYRLPVRRLYTSSKFENQGQIVTVNGVFVYWFVTDGDITADHSHRMWLMAKNLLTRGVLQRWAYVAVFAQCQPGQEDSTFLKLSELVTDAVPEFQTTTGLQL
jgi:hypothetical protein